MHFDHDKWISDIIGAMRRRCHFSLHLAFPALSSLFLSFGWSGGALRGFELHDVEVPHVA
jgi:hypothetical protein